MASSDWPLERSSMETALATGAKTDAPAVSGDPATMISLLKAVLDQNQTIINNQSLILAKLNAGINVTVIGGGL